MAKKKGGSPGSTAEVCYRLAQPEADALGLKLWDVRFVKEGPTWYLRIFIDREDARVSIEDCVAMSRRMDKVLDEADPINHSYCLEVSSPGVERELTRPEHFEEYMGRPVIARLHRPVDGMREFKGALVGFDQNAITIKTDDGASRTFAKKELSSVRLAEDWDDFEYGGETENE